jgi:hypothetical protein
MTKIENIKILCLNLPRRKDRKRNAEIQFALAGINEYEIIPAIDGQAYQMATQVTSKYLKSKSNPHGFITRGWIANHISYQQIFQWAQIAYPGQDLLIFEDDVILKENFVERYNTVLAQLPQDCDLLYTGVWDWKPEFSHSFNELLYIPGLPILAHCVYYRASTIPVIAQELRTFKNTYDVQLAEELIATGILKAYATKEALANQNGAFDSDGSIQ